MLDAMAGHPSRMKKTVVCFVWFVSFVWLNQTNSMNETNQINPINKTNQINQFRPAILLDKGLPVRLGSSHHD